MNYGGIGGEFISLARFSKQTSKRLRALKRTYSELCTSGTSSEALSFFADNFHTVIASAGEKYSRKSSAHIFFNGRFELAEALISSSDGFFGDTDETVMTLRKVCSKRRVYGCEIEYLRFTVVYTLIERIHEAVKADDKSLIRYMTLLCGIGSLDTVRINDILNPVAIKLSADRAYSQSDPRTRLSYREAIYKTALKFQLDEMKLCDELIEKYSGADIDIKSLTVIKNQRLGEGFALLSAAAIIFGALAISLAVALWAGSPFSAIFLFLPATEALRPLSDRLLTLRQTPQRLMRLDPESKEVKNTPVAIVLSEAVFGPESAEKLYDKLLRLHCLNPADNIRICALLDLAPDRVPITSEDRAVIDSLSETVARLNAAVDGKFSCLVRKRTFSETQQEYMGAMRKRGALAEAARFMTTGQGDFYAALGSFESLIGTKYICAVDSDTRPLMDSVSELLAVALHPANKAVLENGRVVGGYGIIAPRMIVRLGDSLRTEFSKSLGGIGSRSSYDEESANLYADVFGRGTFCGKGLINAEALFDCSSLLSGERILSHDIFEGELLRTAYAGDICFSEGFPRTPQSYYRRLDRWIRGDFQNLPEIFSKKYSALSKLKLLDNLRRAAIPVSVFAAALAGFFTEPLTSGIIAAAALILWLMPQIFGSLCALFSDRAIGRRFYSGLLSAASQSARFILYSIVMLPTLAIKSLRAILTALTRLITGRRLLEWTTSDASDISGQNPLSFYFLPEVLSLALLKSPDYFIRLLGAVFSAMPALLAINDGESALSEPKLRYGDIRELSKQTADMWGFFEEHVTRDENFLPPDNVQFSPVYRVAHRTSPTNIGLYLLSALAAHDRRLISQKALLTRLEGTLKALSRMEKYRGNLYNWYDTKTLALLPNPFVSSVDSGNFVCCLVTLKEGLKELEPSPRVLDLIAKTEKIIAETDLSIFYDDVRGLMSIGIDPKSGTRVRSHYDYLMSESRLASFWAIASRQVPKSHWQRLSRAMLRTGFFGGAASYSGTMFEYFMPEIFLKSPEGSLFGESLRYALWVQRRYASRLGRPYGISESGYYSFDSALNYRYMAHGVPNTGVRRGLEQSYVVSPYSTYISLCFSGGDGAENLRKLSEYGMYGSYGFYEALDFTAPDSDKPEPVRSYMAHHVGMSICSCDNILGDGIMQRRFMRDMSVRGALELLDERFHLGTAVFENALRRPKASSPEPLRTETEAFDSFSLTSPRIKLLSNGELTLLITDSGICQSLYRSKNVYSKTRDPMRPKGIYSFVSDGGDALSLSYLPDRSPDSSAEFGEDFAAFYKSTEKLSAGMKIRLHSEYPCEVRTFALKNETAEPLPVSVLNYLEPSLCDGAAEQAHPAFSKMFLRLSLDPEWNIATVTRVREEKSFFVGVGFVEDIRTAVSFNRSEVLSFPDGVEGLGRGFEDIPQSLISEPDPCVYIRASVELPPKSEAEFSLFILCADSKDELINRVAELRRKKPKFTSLPRLDTARGRVASELLPKILYGSSQSDEKSEAVRKNRLPLRALWEISVSTELPLVLVMLNGRNDRQKLSAYLGAYKLLRLCGVGLQLVFAFDDGGRYEREHYSELIAAAKEEGLESSVYSSGGILPLDLSKARSGLLELCLAAACHICTEEIAPPADEIITALYKKILPSAPVAQKVDYPVACGGFCGESYVINEKPPLPWCHVLSSPVFGTLLSSGSLGFTFAFNSRENRLTPWDNDPSRDNLGERLILNVDGTLCDLIRGSAAVFSPYKAEYFSTGENYSAKVTVTVSKKGADKRVSVDIKTSKRALLAYYCEPCVGADRSRAGMIIPLRFERGLTFYAPASETEGFMSLSCSKPCSATTERTAFFCGDWEEKISPSDALIGAIFAEVSGKETIVFDLSFGLTKASAEAMPKYYVPQTDTRERRAEIPDGSPAEKLMANTWLRYPALHARIWARTGFWQCSGAYGFRDQLQDAVGIAAENPRALKTQILRCCLAQFEEGDVLHWWHTLPRTKTRGIRTRISDDALWLPYAVCEYISQTGDRDILNLEVSFCGGLSLGEGENERYGEVYKTSEKASVYEHCRRAVDRSASKTGRHGLMLIGSGDWNDGFGSVGKNGEGESVWLTEFYIIVLKRFADVALSFGDPEYSSLLNELSEALSESVEKKGRDKTHYLRAYFDDGSKLGSAKNPECRIDSIAQSFAEFAGLGRDGFSRLALLNAYAELADIRRGVIKLFTPPFSDSADPDPGYIKSYPEGMRENGGQYTHGAVWLGLACLRAGLTEEGNNILDALNPITRSENGGYKRYMAEPYYLCGDVYTNKNCHGRGGWSIYTGSAAWYYKALREKHKNRRG